MTDHARTHERSSDATKAFIWNVPGWAKQLGATVTLVVALLTWMDNRYATGKDVEKKAEKTEVTAMQGTLNEMKDDLKDIKRAMYRRDAR